MKIKEMYCQQCGCFFKYEAYEKRRKFCSINCKNINQSTSHEGQCLNCNKTIKIIKSYARKYCCQDCAINHKSKLSKGKRVVFSLNFRKRILQKYNYKCVMCDYSHYNPYPLNLHHMDSNPRNTVDNNIVPLCVSCHRRTHLRYEGKKNFISMEMIQKKIYSQKTLDEVKQSIDKLEQA